jgi:hypothetical protein
MFLSECLIILVSQGKLEKVLDRYKISELENKVLEVAPEVVAMKLAESDNKRLIAAEAVEEEERMHKLVEESHTMLQLCLEIHQQCNLNKTHMVHQSIIITMIITVFCFVSCRCSWPRGCSTVKENQVSI